MKDIFEGVMGVLAALDVNIDFSDLFTDLLKELGDFVSDFGDLFGPIGQIFTGLRSL